MSPVETTTVVIPVDVTIEVKLMGALENLIHDAWFSNVSNDDRMRAVDWLHAKYGSKK